MGIYSQTCADHRCTLRVSVQNPNLPPPDHRKCVLWRRGTRLLHSRRVLALNHTLQRSLLPPRLNRQLPLIRSPSPSFETAWEILRQLDGVWTVFWQETTWNRSNESEVLFNSVKTGKFQQLQSGNLSPSATEAEARWCIIWRVVAGSLLWFVVTQCQLLKMFWSKELITVLEWQTNI